MMIAYPLSNRVCRPRDDKLPNFEAHRCSPLIAIDCHLKVDEVCLSDAIILGLSLHGVHRLASIRDQRVRMPLPLLQPSPHLFTTPRKAKHSDGILNRKYRWHGHSNFARDKQNVVASRCPAPGHRQSVCGFQKKPKRIRRRGPWEKAVRPGSTRVSRISDSVRRGALANEHLA